jgi:hypothetical protein
MRTVTLNVSDTSQGFVKINTIDILPSTPGVPQKPYPWTGSYFADIPLTVTAIPKKGFDFSHWSGDTTSVAQTLTMVPKAGMSLTANFKPAIINNNPDEIISFWLIGNNIANDVPLESITSSFSKTVTPGKITFESCLKGYPFTPSHPNWRKASMERRNKPSFLNYNPIVNNNISAENAGIRGLQIKQPFKSNGLENVINFTINTRGFENIKWAFAVADEGAVSFVITEYFDKNKNVWTTQGLSTSTFHAGVDYSVKEVDLSGLLVASDNTELRCRIRFDGPNLTADAGNRITFNNFSFTGKKISTVNQFEEVLSNLIVYPNPVSHILSVQSDNKKLVQKTSVYSWNGIKILQQENNLKVQNFELDLSQIPPGIVLIRFIMEDGSVVSRKVIKE